MKTNAAILILALAACNSGDAPDKKVADVPLENAADTTWGTSAKNYALLDLPNLDDNVKGDTLLVYTTHQVGNDLFVMAAKNKEDKREGLRLYLYTPRPDSTADVLAVSAPAYDSSTMLPTYFTTSDTADGMVILANFGEKESWGQKVFWLKGHEFRDLGWLDVAHREWKTRDDSTVQWRTNIAPFARVQGRNDQFKITFTGDSLQLFDDLAGNQERMFATGRIAYRYDGRQMVLYEDGQERLPKHPL